MIDDLDLTGLSDRQLAILDALLTGLAEQPGDVDLDAVVNGILGLDRVQLANVVAPTDREQIHDGGAAYAATLFDDPKSSKPTPSPGRAKPIRRRRLTAPEGEDMRERRPGPDLTPTPADALSGDGTLSAPARTRPAPLLPLVVVPSGPQRVNLNHDRELRTFHDYAVR